MLCRWSRRTGRALSTATDAALRQSPLNDLHLERGGKMVPFAGWSLPVQYAGIGVLNESLHTRNKASIFDVSHMQQLKIHGEAEARLQFLESVCTSSIGNLQPHQGQYTLFTNPKGGIIDDAVITNQVEHHHIVCNAACSEKDIAHLSSQIKSFNQNNKKGVEIEIISDQALIALQGPKAAEVLLQVLDGDTLDDLYFFFSKKLSLRGILCSVSRSGYTGEDGFEISIPIDSSRAIVSELLSNNECQLAGLGARDALRLEAGLSLYGHDLDDDTSPIEAGLSWTIGKRRRKEGGFLGADHILGQLQGSVPVQKTRVGMKVDGAPAREGTVIVDNAGKEIGKVTSGGFSPTLKHPIAMGYVDTETEHAVGTSITVQVRKNVQPATIVSMPFVPTKYIKKPSTGKSKK